GDPGSGAGNAGSGGGGAGDAAAVLVDQVQELVAGERPAEVVTLGEIASEVRQALEGDLVLDAFGDNVQSEVVAEIDGGADDDQIAFVVWQRGDEAAIDLQLVDRQALEVRKRGVAGAEIVD